jgi:sigma-B regulation protein RsbU (phosphoserine phosphatase)
VESDLKEIYERISKAVELPPYKGFASLKDIANAMDKILIELNERRKDCTKLLEEHIEELSKTYQEIATLFELNNLLANVMDPEEKLDALVELLKQTIPFFAISIELDVMDKHTNYEQLFDFDRDLFERSIRLIEQDDQVLLIEPSQNNLVRNLLSVPVKSSDIVWGRITLVERSPDFFTAADRKILEATAQLLASICERYVRLKREVERQRLKEQLEIARQIQKKLFPSRLPSLSYVEISADSIPAIQVGGDYYDILVKDDKVFVTVADVSGKGIPAALMMTSLRSALRTLYRTIDDISKLAIELNNALCDDLEEDRFVTMILLCLHSSGVLQFVNAGHNPVLLLSGSDLKSIRAQDMPLGIIKDITYKMFEAKMKPGDLLVAYTDGVTEARDKNGNEYGFERLYNQILMTREKTAVEIIERIKADVDDFSYGTQRHDDTTITVIKYLGENLT